MKLEYRRAESKDLELLTATRIEVLLAANQLPQDTDMETVSRNTREYYRRALEQGTHTAYLVFDGNQVVGTGGVSYFQVMPTYHNPSGEKAYIMNMYTHPDYRRQGIASYTLNLLVQDAKARAITAISLEATAQGRPLYKKYGFEAMENEMELPET